MNDSIAVSTKNNMDANTKTKESHYNSRNPNTTRDMNMDMDMNVLRQMMNLSLHIMSTLAAYSLNQVGQVADSLLQTVGVDTSNDMTSELQQWGQKAANMQSALNTPQGRLAIRNATALLILINRQILIPAFKESMDTMMEYAEPILTRAQNALYDIVSASPLGPLFDIPKLGIDLLGVFENMSAMVSTISSTSNETLGKLKEKQSAIQQVLNELRSAFDQVIAVPQATGWSTGEDATNPYAYASAPEAPWQEGGAISMNMNMTMNDMRNQTMQLGGRIHQSTQSFLHHKPSRNTKRAYKYNKPRKPRRKTRRMKSSRRSR